MFNENAIQFYCQKKQLIGILHSCDKPSSLGVLILVGGPQYRPGSHRQFVMLARYLAQQGLPVLRFDYRGMGDSDGDFGGFENTEEDTNAAIDFFFSRQAKLRSIVICGLCDAASSACFFAHKDPRVKGLVLMNPWVRSDAGIAKAYLRHYYLERLADKETWRRIVTGQFDFRKSISSLFSQICSAFPVFTKHDHDNEHKSNIGQQTTTQWQTTDSLADRVFRGLKAYNGKVLLILSGNDLTAAEFKDAINRSRRFRRIVNSPRFSRFHFDEADHTFSRIAWKRQVETRIFEWICDLD